MLTNSINAFVAQSTEALEHDGMVPVTWVTGDRWITLFEAANARKTMFIRTLTGCLGGCALRLGNTHSVYPLVPTSALADPPVLAVVDQSRCPITSV